MDWRRLLLVMALAAPLLGCTQGNECDKCETDADCQQGLLCVNFEDSQGNSVGKRCGSGVGASTCRVRR
jgi:hypothetical protein